MFKMTERDKWLAVMFPSLVIFTVYGLFFFRTGVMDLRQKRESIEKATPPTDAEIAAKRGEAARVARETQMLQLKLQEALKKWSYETAFCAAGMERHVRVEQFTNLLNKHQLTSMEDTEAENGGKDFHPSAALESLVHKISQLSSDHKPELRRIRFFGRFVNVHDALDELTKGPVLVIPVGLSMKLTDHPDLREWTLLVWL